MKNRCYDLYTLHSSVKQCQECELCEKRVQAVSGTGNEFAQLMFIAQCPGTEEEELDLPLVGSSGKLLTQTLLASGISRSDSYFTNVVKCHPPRIFNASKNQYSEDDPKRNHIESCEHFIKEEIELINPRIICTVGRISTGWILKEFNDKTNQYEVKIHDYHGKLYDGIVGEWRGYVYPIYHPSYVLRTPSAQKEFEADIKQLFLYLIKGVKL